MKNNEIKIIILSGYGLNCEEETKFAFEWAGGEADIVHINDLIKNPKMLLGYQIMVFPGGFSYGDDTGSGKAYANKFKNHLSKELKEFLSRNTLVLGICNGFQIMTNLGILPGGLTYNKNRQYIDRWVDLEIPPSPEGLSLELGPKLRSGVGRGFSPWLKNIKKISLPIAHGEGHYIISQKEYQKMKKGGQIAFVYIKGEICKFQNLEKNPNGSDYDIAGVLAYNGRVLGLMPHPERAMFSHQNPLWYKNKIASSAIRRKGGKMPKEGTGLQIFKNAINYFLNS